MTKYLTFLLCARIIFHILQAQ